MSTLTSGGMTSIQRAGSRVIQQGPGAKPMPFVIVQRGDQHCVYTEGEGGKPKGDPHGCHPTREKAMAQMRALYANVPEARKDDEPETSEVMMITLGPAVKAMGNGKISGYLVTWGDEATKDAEGEWFTADTDFDTDFPARASVYYHHGQDPAVGRQRLTHGEMQRDDFGVRINAQLDVRDPKQAAIYRRVEKGELGWSSGSLPHITIPPRENPGGAIKQWPLGHDGSLTPIPSDKRNAAVACKSCPLPPVEELQTEEGDVRSPSLVEATNRWMESGERLIGDYSRHAMKAGRKLSAARRTRLTEMRQMIDDMLSETDPRDTDADGDASLSPVTGEGDEVGKSAAAPAAGGAIELPISSVPDLHDLYAAATRQSDRTMSLIGR